LPTSSWVRVPSTSGIQRLHADGVDIPHTSIRG
jgi:hypothetical protein